MTVVSAAVVFVHVALGTIVLVVAPAALLTRKGGRWHRRWGNAFSIAMVAVIVTAAFMWQSKGHVFLLYLDVVCAYLVFMGYRIIARRKRRVADGGADTVDLVAACVVLLSAAGLFALGATARTSLMRELAPVLVALGVIAVTFALLDVRALRAKAQTRKGSLLIHISATVGAYISAVTAFCVINFHAVPMSLRWIVPSALGTIVIGIFSVQTRRRFARTEARARLVANQPAAAGGRRTDGGPRRTRDSVSRAG